MTRTCGCKTSPNLYPFTTWYEALLPKVVLCVMAKHLCFGFSFQQTLFQNSCGLCGCSFVNLNLCKPCLFFLQRRWFVVVNVKQDTLMQCFSNCTVLHFQINKWLRPVESDRLHFDLCCSSKYCKAWTCEWSCSLWNYKLFEIARYLSWKWWPVPLLSLQMLYLFGIMLTHRSTQENSLNLCFSWGSHTYLAALIKFLF